MIMARVQMNGSNISQSDISAVERKIFDADGSTPDTAEDTSDLTVASVVFDDLQTDDRWTEDSTGYNFRDTVVASLLSSPTRYRIEYKFTGAAGEVFFIRWYHRTVSIWGS